MDKENSGTQPDSDRVLLEESRRTLDHQLKKLDSIKKEIARIIGFNLTLAGLTVGLVSFLESSSSDDAILQTISDVDTMNLELGALFLISSTLIAAVAYTSTTTRGGASYDDLDVLKKRDPDSDERIKILLKSYPNWILKNYKKNLKVSILSSVALISMVLGISSLIIGSVDAVAGLGWYLEVAIISVIGLVFIHQSGVITNIRTYTDQRSKGEKDN